MNHIMKRTPLLLLPLFVLFAVAPSYPEEKDYPRENVSRARHIFLTALKEKDNSKKKKLIREFVSLKGASVEYICSELEWANPGYLNMFETIIPRLAKYAEDPFLYLLGDTSENKVAIAARWLGLMKSRKAVVPLLILLDDPRPSVRANAAFALGEIGDRTVFGKLMKTLKDSIPAVRRNGANALGKLKCRDAVFELVSLLGDSSYSVAYAASNALKNIAAPETVDTLLVILPQSSGVLRYHIIETLGFFASPKALPSLLSLLESSSSVERGIVCEALSFYRGNYKVGNALKRSVADPSPFVSMEARNALERFRGN